MKWRFFVGLLLFSSAVAAPAAARCAGPIPGYSTEPPPAGTAGVAYFFQLFDDTRLPTFPDHTVSSRSLMRSDGDHRVWRLALEPTKVEASPTRLATRAPKIRRVDHDSFYWTCSYSEARVLELVNDDYAAYRVSMSAVRGTVGTRFATEFVTTATRHSRAIHQDRPLLIMGAMSCRASTSPDVLPGQVLFVQVTGLAKDGSESEPSPVYRVTALESCSDRGCVSGSLLRPARENWLRRDGSRAYAAMLDFTRASAVTAPTGSWQIYIVAALAGILAGIGFALCRRPSRNIGRWRFVSAALFVIAAGVMALCAGAGALWWLFALLACGCGFVAGRVAAG